MFGKDAGLLHEAMVTGRKVGAGKNFWRILAEYRDVFWQIAEQIDPLSEVTITEEGSMSGWLEKGDIFVDESSFQRCGSGFNSSRKAHGYRSYNVQFLDPSTTSSELNEGGGKHEAEPWLDSLGYRPATDWEIIQAIAERPELPGRYVIWGVADNHPIIIEDDGGRSRLRMINKLPINAQADDRKPRYRIAAVAKDIPAVRV